MRNAPALDMQAVRAVEQRLREVYNFCPPTQTYFKSPESRTEYGRFWGQFFRSLGVGPERFRGQRVLDIGCGSCEKTCFYYDWGARVTGIDLTPEVLAIGREVIGARDIQLMECSLFDLQPGGGYDIVVIDGVSFITAGTCAALKKAVEQLVPGGLLVFSIANVWGSFWWFRFARFITSVLGGSDFHKRAQWGRRLFMWTRSFQEGTEENCRFYRSERSWQYDWFGPPAYHLHSPFEIHRWLEELGLTHLGSVPSIVAKENPRNFAAATLRKFAGSGGSFLHLYWMLNAEPNMSYVAAVKSVGGRSI